MDNEEKNNLVIVNMSQVDLPTFLEPYSNQNDWVKYGSDNLFPFKLQDLANRSALHNAIISSKVDNVCGNGFTYEKKTDRKTDKFMEMVNPYDTIDVFYNKIVYDFVLYGGYSINIIWSKDHKTIAEMYHIDFSKLRSGKQDDKGQVSEYFYCKDWMNYKKKENTPKPIPAYKKNSKQNSELLYVKEYRPGTEYYPLPSYVGALSYIEIDTEISNFHLSHLKNGMQPSVMMNFVNGIPTDEERRKVERSVTSKFSGSDNAGKFIITFSDGKDNQPTVEQLSTNDLDKQFIQLQDTVLQNILSGHKVVSPMLVGIRTPGQLGGTTELETAFSLYQNNVIKPIQTTTLNTINMLGAINGLQPLSIIPIKPIEFSFSERVLVNIMTQNEMRSMMNLEPLDTLVVPTSDRIPSAPVTPIKIN